MKKWLRAILFLAVSFILLAGFSPLLAEKFVLPPILARAGLEGYRVSISRLGIGGCSMHIAARPGFTSPVVTGDVRIDWSPANLLQRRIDRVSSNGLQINLINLPEAGQKSDAGTKNGPASSGGMPLPVLVEEVMVENGSLVYRTGNSLLVIPFSFSGDRVGDDSLQDPAGALYFRARLQAGENAAAADIRFTPAGGELAVTLHSDVDLASLPSFHPTGVKQLREITGHGKVEAAAVMRLAPFALASMEAGCTLENLRISGRGFAVRSGKNQPAMVSISVAGSEFKVTGTGLFADAPIQTSLNGDGRISITGNDLEWEGVLVLAPLDGRIAAADDLLVENVPPLKIHYEGAKRDSGMVVLFATEYGAEHEEKDALQIRQNGVKAAVGSFSAEVRMTRKPETADSLSGTIAIQGGNLRGQTGQGSFQLPHFSLDGEWKNAEEEQGGPGIAGRLIVEDASYVLEKQGIRIQGGSLDIPLSWPAATKSDNGSIGVASLRKDDAHLGSLAAGVVQEGNKFRVDGDLQTVLLPGERIDVTAVIRPPSKKESFADFAFALPATVFAAQNFASVFPVLKGIKGKGEVKLNGDLSISPCGISGEAELALTNGSLQLDEGGAAFEDINLSLYFPDFPAPATGPMQKLSVGSLRKKNIAVDDVEVVFAIESSGSLFIEKIAGRWGGGRVFTSSFRLQKGLEKLDIALFGDRLKLASILSQFKLAEAGGEGRLSGRIPISYAGGKFFVDDGFLYSTPGEKGQLKIKQSKYLQTTIPADVPHFSPLQFAGAALADFEYNWAKLQIESVEENLLMKLQVDGRPREKLPFRYDPGKNAFVRLEEGIQGGLDQPVKLDVNFKVPVNELLEYKDTFMPLFRKFK